MAYTAPYIGRNDEVIRVEIVSTKHKYKVQLVYTKGQRKTYSRPGTRDSAELDLERAAVANSCVVSTANKNVAIRRSSR